MVKLMGIAFATVMFLILATGLIVFLDIYMKNRKREKDDD